MRKVASGLVQFLSELAAILVLCLGADALLNGIPLFGVPDVDGIQSVSISCPGAAGTGIETSSREDVELAQNLTSFLYYDPFAKVDGGAELSITITYFLWDGTQTTVAASGTAVWWNGKAHGLKRPGQFVKLVEGAFFPETLPAEGSSPGGPQQD